MDATGRSSGAGFTLVEMLVVMVLLGLIASMVLPSMQRWHDIMQARSQSAAIVDALRAASFASGVNRRDIVMDAESFAEPPAAVDPPASSPSPAGASTPLLASAEPTSTTSTTSAATPANLVRRVHAPLPHGWTVQRVVPAVFLANGLCRPGLVALKTERQNQIVIRVAGPVCGVELSQPGAADGASS